MINFFKKIISFFKGEKELGASTQQIAGSVYYLSGSGISSSATSITLTSFTIPQNGYKILSTDLSSVFYITIDPGNTSRQEIVSCTGVTQNANGTATLTGCTRGLNPVQPYTETSSLKFPHGGGSKVIISNPPHIYEQYGALANDETITGYWKSPDPVDATDIANKQWVLSEVNGGAVSFERVVVAGTCGEDVTVGQLVYLKTSDSKWWKADADLTATVDNIQLGLTQGSGSANGAITGGVLVSGLHTTSGLTANSLYYASNTAGGISTTTGTLTKVIGQAVSTTKLLFNPNFYTNSTSNPTGFVSTSAGAGDSGKGVKLNASGVLDSSFGAFEFGDGSDGDVTIAAGTTTLTRDMFYNNLVVTGTLATDGFRIFVKGTISGAGIIQGVTGNNGTAGVNGANHAARTGGAGATASGTGILKTVAGGKGGDTFLNAAGQVGTVGTAGGAGQTGKNGGAGGAGVDGAGALGAGGVYGNGDKIKGSLLLQGFYITNAGAVAPMATPSSGGGGGGGSCDAGGSNDGGAGSGGGGGASGGTILLCARNWTGTFTIKSLGGNGANGGASDGALPAGGGGGGGGGNGGTSIVVYGLKSWTGSYLLTGGTAGTGGASGGGYAGENGTAGASGIQLEIPASYLI
jgi:hypothetical protein